MKLKLVQNANCEHQRNQAKMSMKPDIEKTAEIISAIKGLHFFVHVAVG